MTSPQVVSNQHQALHRQRSAGSAYSGSNPSDVDTRRQYVLPEHPSHLSSDLPPPPPTPPVSPPNSCVSQRFDFMLWSRFLFVLRQFLALSLVMDKTVQKFKVWKRCWYSKFAANFVTQGVYFVVFSIFFLFSEKQRRNSTHNKHFRLAWEIYRFR